MPNAFHMDVSHLDVDAFVSGALTAFPLLALAWAAALLKVRRAGWLFAGVLLANTFAWWVSTHPLQRVYALGPSHDRINNVAMCQVVAAGNSPLRTIQVRQLHFEPLWGALVAALSGWDPARVLILYPFLTLAVLLAVCASVYAGLAPLRGDGTDAPGLTPWERALFAGFFTLLSSTALDFAGTYRVPWAMTFLLKPNHALGLVLLPLVLRAVAAARTWKGRLFAGFLLHLLGWAFVLHMVYVCAGLVLFALESTLRRRTEASRDRMDVAIAIGVNLLVVSPYLFMLVTGYPILGPTARHQIPPFSAHMLEVTASASALLVLAAWGARVFVSSGGRLGRLWVAQLVSAVLLWSGYYLLSPLSIAKERDELFYWVRFLTAGLAAVGAWDLAGRALLRVRAGAAPELRAVAIVAAAVPFMVPTWWDPRVMDPYFLPSVPPIEEAIRSTTDYLRTRTDPKAVVAGDRGFVRWAAALGGRRCLLALHFHMPVDYGERVRLEDALVREAGPAAARDLLARYGVRYLAVTPSLLTANGVTLADLDARAHLRSVHRAGDPASDFVVLYELVPG